MNIKEKAECQTNKIAKRFKRCLAFWELFIGIGAFFGAAMMFYDTSGKSFGMDLMLSDIQKLPFSDMLFQNFLFCGLALFFINGVTNLIAYIMLVRKNRYAGIAGVICGIILMLWITVQFIIFPLNPMSTIYFIFGVIQAYFGYKYYFYMLNSGKQ